MAEFKKAYNATLIHEGGHGNDPEDAGGETYKGISRVYYPRWTGWKIIDNSKVLAKFPDNLKDNWLLEKKVQGLYKNLFWNIFQGDKINNQFVANELFDTGVNQGVMSAVRYLQISLNLLNRDEKNYPDIVEDGLFGKQTLKTLHIYLSIDIPTFLLTLMNVLQGMHYVKYMRRSPVQEKHARGWLKRVWLCKYS